MLEIKVTRLPESENIEIKKMEFSDVNIVRFASFLANMTGDSLITIYEYDDKDNYLAGYVFKNPSLVDINNEE